MKHFASLSIPLLMSLGMSAHGADLMKAFPPAEAGMVRHVLQVPKAADESVLQIELMVGKTVAVDEKNRYFFGGEIATETIKGWGYTMYRVGPLGPMAGTLMAVDPNAPKVPRFVGLGGDPFLIRYNSRLPVVVYAPEGVEVRYRVWRTVAESTPLENG